MKKQHGLLRSFVDGSSDSDFSLYNLPYGVFCYPGAHNARTGTAIGRYVLDLTLLEEKGLLTHEQGQSYFNHGSLNVFASTGPSCWSSIRHQIQQLLKVDNIQLQGNQALLDAVLIPMDKVQML